MRADDAMTINERRKYLTKMQTRYRAADRRARSALLTEMEAVTGMHRKSLTRLMAQSTLKRVRTPDRSAAPSTARTCDGSCGSSGKVSTASVPSD